MFFEIRTVNFTIGQTDDLERRWQEHNDPGHTLTRTTKRFRGPWKLVYSEKVSSRSAALVRGKALKSGVRILPALGGSDELVERKRVSN